MELTIDGRVVPAQPGKSLLDLTRALGLEGATLKDRPLAA